MLVITTADLALIARTGQDKELEARSWKQRAESGKQRAGSIKPEAGRDESRV